MKVAVILIGLKRTWEFTHNSFVTAFDDADYFVHSWTKDFIENYSQVDENSFTTEKITPIKVVVEEQNGPVHIWRKAYLGFRMMEDYATENQIEYDVVVITRPDIIWLDRLPVIEENQIIVNLSFGGGWPPDSCHIGSFENIRSLVYLYEVEFMKHHLHNSHLWMGEARKLLPHIRFDNVLVVLFVYDSRHPHAESNGSLILDAESNKLISGKLIPFVDDKIGGCYWCHRN